VRGGAQICATKPREETKARFQREAKVNIYERGETGENDQSATILRVGQGIKYSKI
jgi:hypothetical protein